MKKSETRLVVSPTIRNAQTARIGTVRIALWLAISMLLIMGIALQPLAALLSPSLAALLPQAKSALAAPPQQAGTATIGNFVWNDLDKDGIQDAGEPGIVGVSMALYTPAGALVQSTASIAGGAYAFNNVAAGTYLVSVEPSNFAIGNLVGFGLSPTGVGTPSTDSNGVFVAGASIYTATIGAGATNNDIDFGFYAAGKSTIGNYVWYDANADGDHQGAESEFAAGINGVVLHLYLSDGDANFEPGADDVLYAVTTTGDDPNTAGTQTGWYQFNAEGNNTYFVQVIASNFAPGGPLNNLQFTNDGNPYQNANPQIVALNTAIATDNTIDFGYVAISDLSVTKSDNPDPVTPGRVLTYTINYANAGPSIATNVRLTDTLPAGVTYGGVVSEVPAISGPTINGQTLVWVTPTLAVNASGTIVFTVTVNSGVSGTITNTVRISSSAYDPTPDNNRDDEPTPVVNPGIDIDKRLVTPVSGSTTTGNNVVFAVELFNTGDTNLTTVELTDTWSDACLSLQSISPDPGPPSGAVCVGGGACSITWSNVGPLSVSQSKVFTFTFLARYNPIPTIPPTLPDCSPTTNTASTSGVDENGTPVGPVEDTADVNIYQPAIEIAKTPDLQQVVSGGTVTFTIRVTNTGDVALNPVAVSDPNAPNCNRANVGPLTPGQGTSYTCSLTNVPADFTNVATATGTPPVGPPVTDDDDAVVDVIGPNIAIAKTPDLQTVIPGSTVTFTIRVTNTGNVTLTNVIVTDPQAPNCDRTFASMAPGAVQSYTCSVSPVNAGFTNIATVTGTPPVGPPVTDNDDARVDLFGLDFGDAPDPTYPTLLASNGARHVIVPGGPALNLGLPDAEADGQPTAGANGDDNTGIDDENGVGMPTLYAGYQALIGLSSNQTAFLNAWIDYNRDGDWNDAGEQIATNAQLIGGAAVLPINVPANAVAGPSYARFRYSSQQGLTPVGLASNGEVEDYVVSIVRINPGIAIAKTPDLQQVVSGATVTFTIRVTNTGDITLTNVTVADPLAPNCDRTFASMGPGAVQNYQCTIANVTADFTNVANVRGTPPAGPDVTDTDDAVVDVIGPAITIAKTPDSQTVIAGSTVTFTIRVTNSGDVVLTNVSVNDPLAPGCNRANLGSLNPGQSTGYTCSVSNVTAGFTNVATATGTPPVGPPVTDDDDAVVIVRANGAIGDYVWYDTDADGIQDVGEPGIGNVVVYLYEDTDNSGTPTINDTLVATRVTGTSGDYLFTGLPAGDYYVDIPAGANPGLTGLIPTAGPQSMHPVPTSIITLALNESYRDADFGYVRTPGQNAVIGDFVWYDGDGDGFQDPGEPGIPGIVVVATPVGGGAPFTATTDATGKYLIVAPPGSYVVAPAPGQPALSGLTPTTINPVNVTVVAGQQYLDADFGYFNNALGSIGNQVWNDTPASGNGDGIYTPGEPVFANVSVDLIRDLDGDKVWDAGEPIIATLDTDAAGQYLFTGLVADDYLVRVSDTWNVLALYEPTVPGPNPGQNNNNQVQPYAIALGVNADNLTADFGYVRTGGGGQGDPLGRIGDQIWFDVDGDGLFEPGLGEQGIAGVTVELFSGGLSQGELTTNGSGNYVYQNLAAGIYTVTVTDRFNVLANYLPTRLGATGVNNNNQVQPYTVVLATDTDINLTADFGYTLVTYQVNKILNTQEPVRPGGVISFTILVTNTSGLTITVLPLRDTYDVLFLTYANATPSSVDNTNDGVIDWSDLTVSFNRDLGPGQSFSVLVNFVARADTTRLSPDGKTPNVATVRGAQVGGNVLPDRSDEARVRIEAPTGVLLDTASVAVAGEQVSVSWTTLNEATIAGFNVWRRNTDGLSVRVNAALIAAQQAGTASGAIYSFSDAVEIGKVYEYMLEAIGLDGSSSQHVLGIVATGKRVYLPLIGR
jgi:uncharacterized repeat protein (TIGR01451 family)